MDRTNEKARDDDLDDIGIKDELERISARIERIVKLFEAEGQAGKTEQNNENRGI